MRLGRRLLILLLLLPGACARPQPPVLTLGDHVIAGAETWSGEVRISGVVTVKKTGSLTILPGTRVLFAKVDRDGDGIGDAELLVEGRLVARGRSDQPILFSSAEQEPAPADWKYLYLDFARPAEISHLISEYAYSGIQIHFSKAQLTDSEFRYNIDGVRFSTVNLELARNLIHHNRNGLRYEERRSTGRVHHNTIRDNDVGLFVVTRSSGRVLVEQNNIVNNREYQVKFGLQQRRDVAFPRNWWGTTDPRAILRQFFDQRFDGTLGQADAPQFLLAPVPGTP